VNDSACVVRQWREDEFQARTSELAGSGVGRRHVALAVAADADPEGLAPVVPAVTAYGREPQAGGIGAVMRGDQLA
jgi:hypothetical protein